MTKTKKGIHTFVNSIIKTNPMKTKILLLLLLFVGISAVTFAQSQSTTPADKKEAPAQASSVDQPAAKADCKWVDANNDGICDTCGKKDCGSKGSATMSKGCDPASCNYHKEGTKPSSCCPSKSGKKKK